MIAEAFKSIRTKLLFASPDTDLRSVLVSSAIAKEGKTFFSIGLSLSMARMGKNTLLVDADMRRPSVSKAFALGSIGESIGLSSLIMKRVSLKDCVQTPKGFDNLNLLLAGPKPPDPSELLSSRSMGELLAEVKQQYDMVVIDCPPILGLADTLALAGKVDGCLIVIRHRKTSRKNVVRAKSAILSVNGRIVGAILNRIKAEPMGYYYDEHYHSYYHNSYGDEKKGRMAKKRKEKRKGLFRKRRSLSEDE